jgi:periplasmic divalent cation tolerance protein
MPQVRLLPFDAAVDLARVGAWLRQPEVERWWGPADAAEAAIARHDPHACALIAADGVPVGYLAWQVPTPQELLEAGLADLPADLVDIDLMIGEADAQGRGVGPQALELLAERLRGAGVRTVGLATAEANARARRAYAKAGFTPWRSFVEGGQTMHYLVRDLVRDLGPDPAPAAAPGATPAARTDPARTPLVLVTTTATHDEATRIARALVERRLAACVQLSAIDSVYRWDGSLQHEPEVRLVVKTIAARRDQVEAAIRALHPYTLPQLVAIEPDHVAPDYADWLAQACAGSDAA